MSTKSKIEWTGAAPQRIRAVAAARIGTDLPNYDARIAAGEKWCSRCREWHPRTAFNRDRTRGDGLTNWCRDAMSNHGKAKYVRRSRPIPGRRFVEARDGDALQARRRVNHLVAVGLIPEPNDLPCIDCGHAWYLGERRHEYDHYRGYGANHHEDVQAVCTTCHHKREHDRRTT